MSSVHRVATRFTKINFDQQQIPPLILQASKVFFFFTGNKFLTFLVFRFIETQSVLFAK